MSELKDPYHLPQTNNPSPMTHSFYSVHMSPKRARRGCRGTTSFEKTHPSPRMKNGVDRQEMLKLEGVTASGLAYWARTLEDEGIGYDQDIRRDIAIALLAEGFQRSGHLNGAKTRDWSHRPLEEHVQDRLDAICTKLRKGKN